MTIVPFVMRVRIRCLLVSRRDVAQGRDDVAPVDLELGFLVTVHQVEVELVDAGILELAQLRDVVVDRAQDAEPVRDLVADEGGVR